jgi:hypothetical protein
MVLLPEEHRSHAQHVTSDFLSKPQDIAKALTDAKVTADVFFYSHAQPKPKPDSGAWSNAQELIDVNCTIRGIPPFSPLIFPSSGIPPQLPLHPPPRLLHAISSPPPNRRQNLWRSPRPSAHSVLGIRPRVTLEPNFYCKVQSSSKPSVDVCLEVVLVSFVTKFRPLQKCQTE